MRTRRGVCGDGRSTSGHVGHCGRCSSPCEGRSGRRKGSCRGVKEPRSGSLRGRRAREVSACEEAWHSTRGLTGGAREPRGLLNDESGTVGERAQPHRLAPGPAASTRSHSSPAHLFFSQSSAGLFCSLESLARAGSTRGKSVLEGDSRPARGKACCGSTTAGRIVSSSTRRRRRCMYDRPKEGGVSEGLRWTSGKGKREGP